MGRLHNVSTVSELLGGDPSSAQPLIGYHVLKAVYSPADLTAGRSINTTDTLKQFGAPDRTLAVTIPAANQVMERLFVVCPFLTFSRKLCMAERASQMQSHSDEHLLH